MAKKTSRGERRGEALSKARIVEAAIEILDREGEAALTFRALAAQLETGAGALYWHVADKAALLKMATESVVARALDDLPTGATPREAIRVLGLGVFDVIDDQPWVGASLSREPLQPAGLMILERVGRGLEALGVADAAQFDAVTALAGYIVGSAAQNAANARSAPPGQSREAILAGVAAQWERLDPAAYPFVRRMARRLGDHDDRAQFLAGIDLILAGLEAVR